MNKEKKKNRIILYTCKASNWEAESGKFNNSISSLRQTYTTWALLKTVDIKKNKWIVIFTPYLQDQIVIILNISQQKYSSENYQALWS